MWVFSELCQNKNIRCNEVVSGRELEVRSLELESLRCNNVEAYRSGFNRVSFLDFTSGEEIRKIVRPV